MASGDEYRNADHDARNHHGEVNNTALGDGDNANILLVAWLVPARQRLAEGVINQRTAAARVVKIAEGGNGVVVVSSPAAVERQPRLRRVFQNKRVHERGTLPVVDRNGRENHASSCNGVRSHLVSQPNRGLVYAKECDRAEAGCKAEDCGYNDAKDSNSHPHDVDYAVSCFQEVLGEKQL